MDKATLIASVRIGKTTYIIWPTESGFPFKNAALIVHRGGDREVPGISRYVTAVAPDEVRNTLSEQY